ncbi:MAG: magnesium transporter CorA family protein [Clostridiales bacterium]|nr:magnesium transporter CorA family protein [Clostridiales bacterium]
MISFHKTIQNTLTKIDTIETGCWINLIDPTEHELQQVVEKAGVDSGFLYAALDEEETSRVEMEEDQTLFIVDVPFAEKQMDQNGVIFSTLPLGIIVTQDNLITVCLKETRVISDFTNGHVKSIQTSMKTRFILNLLLRIANNYLFYLRQIEKISSHIERQIYGSLKNKELILLLDLEKSLVYFTTSLKGTKMTLEKMLRGRIIKMYNDDQDLLEDVLIEFKQAIEMADIYSNILSGTMDAFASVISNNLNIIMKVLTIITILMTIPTMIFSYYGMNVEGLPLPVFWFPLVLTAVVTTVVWFILKKRNLY